MPRTKKTPVAATDDAASDQKQEQTVMDSNDTPPPPLLDDEEDESFVVEDEDEDDDEYSDDEEVTSEPILRGLFELFTNDAGANMAQILTQLSEAVEKQNKILYKIMTLLPGGGKASA